jgi:hypothetical protein
LNDQKAGNWPEEVLQRIGGIGGMVQKLLDHQPRCRASVQDVLPVLQRLKQTFASTFTPMQVPSSEREARGEAAPGNAG